MTAPWHIEIRPPARRDLHRLPDKIAAAVIEFLGGSLAENPRRVGRPLGRDLLGVWTARRGSYRILYRIDDRARVVNVVRVDHRRDVYRPR